MNKMQLIFSFLIFLNVYHLSAQDWKYACKTTQTRALIL